MRPFLFRAFLWPIFVSGQPFGVLVFDFLSPARSFCWRAQNGARDRCLIIRGKQ